MKKLLLPIAIVAAVFLYQKWDESRYSAQDAATGTVVSAADDDAIRDAYESQQSGIEVSGQGTVSRILGDDREGDRHQRFIVALGTGHTLLIAHNIDLAPRIEGLAIGDAVAFHGIYEWNDKGGVVHWTHHDPQGQHEAGWIRHRGRTYQ